MFNDFSFSPSFFPFLDGLDLVFFKKRLNLVRPKKEKMRKGEKEKFEKELEDIFFVFLLYNVNLCNIIYLDFNFRREKWKRILM